MQRAIVSPTIASLTKVVTHTVRQIEERVNATQNDRNAFEDEKPPPARQTGISIHEGDSIRQNTTDGPGKVSACIEEADTHSQSLGRIPEAEMVQNAWVESRFTRSQKKASRQYSGVVLCRPLAHGDDAPADHDAAHP